MNHPHALPTFMHKGMTWTVDDRLGEFRHIVFGEVPEFVPFDSEEGEELLEAFMNIEGGDA